MEWKYTHSIYLPGKWNGNALNPVSITKAFIWVSSHPCFLYEMDFLLLLLISQVSSYLYTYLYYKFPVLYTCITSFQFSILVLQVSSSLYLYHKFPVLYILVLQVSSSIYLYYKFPVSFISD